MVDTMHIDGYLHYQRSLICSLGTEDSMLSNDKSPVPVYCIPSGFPSNRT